MFDDQIVQFADCKVIVDVPCRDITLMLQFLIDEMEEDK